ncbi:unannotated protein [freshwater metagenome]|uniref:Unannotated protein n=1 Tax=freshwater metagenome TaxID=449393 RepID=A0A6J6PXL1_9ZZZZ
MTGPGADTIGVVALLALLVTAWRHPRPWVEAATSVVAAASVVVVGLISWDEALRTLGDLAPVVVFLSAVLVVSEVCARAGLFEAAARRIGRWSGGRAVPLLAGVYLLAALVTITLSLDATVVLLTPVVVAAAARRGLAAGPGAWASLRMATSASLLLPVSNLTNLLAMPDLSLTFLGFARAMAPVLIAVLVTEWLVLRWLFRDDLRRAPQPVAARPAEPVAWFPAAVVVVMLVGFAALSPLDVAPGWICAVAAALLVAWALRRRLLDVGSTTRAAHPSFALFVLALGVVVAGLADGFLGDWVAGWVPPEASYAGLLAIAALATVLANLLTNLSATLLLVPLVAPLGTEAVLAALLGLNIGSGLTYTGSLANLLWQRGLAGTPDAVGMVEFHRRALLTTPVVLMVAVTTLHLTRWA